MTRMLPYHRRAYCTSTDIRGMISCWTLVVNSQLKDRFPHPRHQVRIVAGTGDVGAEVLVVHERRTRR